MFTPQQIEEVSFKKATFGGYDMQAVDEFLEPLTQDYITLYKENALLKSKMRVLVGKLEEYRENETAMKDAMVNAQKTCDMMVREAESKCAQMLSDANRAAAENARNATNLIAEEKARVDEARRLAASKISELQLQMSNCLEMLERIKEENRPTISRHTRGRLFDPNAEKAKTGALADEICHNLDAMMGSIDDSDMKIVSRK
ncbi:MAG: DivIVA domain-containing protein [Oscillospiraceae bacterium]|nr:DivIVA domain-containing protein [Oscillospiraceae bacterium]